MQRLVDGASGVHLDLHAPGQEFEVRTSPGGLPFCLVPGAESVRPLPVRWDGANRSIVDQVCLDIPPAIYDAECEFWAGVTGWELFPAGRPEFRRLRKPPGQPLHVLLQRLDEGEGPVRAHLDLATDDREAETVRHEGLGATVVAIREGWTVMRPPAGPVYCLTGRVPQADQL